MQANQVPDDAAYHFRGEQATYEALGKLGEVGKRTSQRLRVVANNISHFSPADLYQYIDLANLENNIEEEKGGRWWPILGLIRNGLILLPLIATWFFLENASSNYAAYITTFDRQHPGQTPHTFLDLWQTGFNTGNFFNTFTAFAIVDIACFALLIIFGVVIDHLAVRRPQPRDDAIRAIQDAIESLTAESLRRMKTGQSEAARVNPVLKPIVDTLRQTSTVADKVVNQMDTVSRGMVTFVNSAGTLDNRLKGILTQIDALGQAATLLSESSLKIATNTEHLEKNVGELKTSQDGTTKRIEGLIGEVKTTTAQTRASTEKLIDSLASFDHNVSESSKRMERAAADVGAGAVQFSRAAPAFESAASEVGKHIDGLKQAAKSMTTSADEFSRQAGVFTGQVANQQALQKQTNALMGSIAGKQQAILDNSNKSANAIALSLDSYVKAAAQVTALSQRLEKQQPKPPWWKPGARRRWKRAQQSAGLMGLGPFGMAPPVAGSYDKTQPDGNHSHGPIEGDDSPTIHKEEG